MFGQILSPLSAGLFRYAIAESGTAAMDALFTTNPLPVAQVKSSSLTAHIIQCCNTDHVVGYILKKKRTQNAMKWHNSRNQQYRM